MELMEYAEVAGSALTDLICLVGLTLTILVVSLWISCFFILYDWMRQHTKVSSRHRNERNAHNVQDFVTRKGAVL